MPKCNRSAVICLRRNVVKPEIEENEVEKRPYIEYVSDCIELLMEQGTDRYGTKHYPILVSILDLRDMQCPEVPEPFMQKYRVTRPPRRNPGGANLLMDQPLLRAMYLLSAITGSSAYSGFADTYIDCYLKNFIDEKGLIWWGWHRYYNVHLDDMILADGGYHEIHAIQSIDWQRLWNVNAQAVTREIEAIWTWHVRDKSTGAVNRHDTEGWGDFAMAIGAHLQAFAFMYAKTGEQKWLDRTRLLASYHWNNRNKKTNLTSDCPCANPDGPFYRGSSGSSGTHNQTMVPGLHCNSLFNAWKLTGDDRFKEYATAYLAAYAQYGFDEETGKYWGSVSLDGTPDRRSRSDENAVGFVQGAFGHIDLWSPYVAGYEFALQTAQMYPFAYQHTGEEVLLTAARRWADCIEKYLPAGRTLEGTWYDEYSREFGPKGTYAEYYGRGVSFFLNLFTVSEDRRYLSLAKKLANEAVSRLVYRGIFKGHAAKPYYEATDGVGHILVALLHLDRVLNDEAGALRDKAISLPAGQGAKQELVGLDNW